VFVSREVGWPIGPPSLSAGTAHLIGAGRVDAAMRHVVHQRAAAARDDG
jgi:hypothetical protein